MKKHIKIAVIGCISVIILGIGGFLFVRYNSESAIELVKSGEYEKAIQKLSLVKIFNKSDEIKNSYEIALYEQEAVPVISELFNQFEEAYKDIRQASTVTEVEVDCRELRDIIEEFEDLENLQGSEISDFIMKIKNNALYTLLKEDYVYGDNLKKINPSYSTNGALSAFAVYTATEIPSDCIDTILNYELPFQVEMYRSSK